MKNIQLLLSLSLNVYNEAENLERVFKEIQSILKKAKISHEIIFIEGGSKDNSWKILQKLAKKNKNVRIYQTDSDPGKKLNKGMSVAKGKYYGYLCSDGQDNPKVIPQFIKILESGKADFVKARRLNRATLFIKIRSFFYNLISDFLFGLSLQDINMHPKIFKRDLVKGIRLISKSESVDLELVLRAKKKGYKIIEMPIMERQREAGNSSVNLRVTFNMIRDMFSYKWGIKKKLLMEKQEE